MYYMINMKQLQYFVHQPFRQYAPFPQYLIFFLVMLLMLDSKYFLTTMIHYAFNNRSTPSPDLHISWWVWYKGRHLFMVHLFQQPDAGTFHMLDCMALGPFYLRITSQHAYGNSKITLHHRWMQRVLRRFRTLLIVIPVSCIMAGHYRFSDLPLRRGAHDFNVFVPPHYIIGLTVWWWGIHGCQIVIQFKNRNYCCFEMLQSMQRPIHNNRWTDQERDFPLKGMVHEHIIRWIVYGERTFLVSEYAMTFETS